MIDQTNRPDQPDQPRTHSAAPTPRGDSGHSLDDALTDPTGLNAVLRPRSVAVIGVSRRPHTIGREIVKNLIDFGFNGPIYPVHPKARHVLSLRTWPSIEEIPDPIDLAVIAVPSQHVLDVVKSCARKGVKGLVIITAGFREVGGGGRALEAEVTRVVREAGMRMVGPNCMGVLNTDAEYRLDAGFGATQPLPGNAAFASQSGGLGEVVLATAKKVGLGISQFVSLGNKADVSGNDLLEWWATDPQTDVILLYLESFGNPRRFAALAREVTRKHRKPILAVKSGRSAQGAAAASSHTGSLAGGDQAATSLLADCGVVRCHTVRQLFDLALGFSQQPLPPGDRVAILTNAGGPGIMATDAAVHFQLQIAEFSPETGAALRTFLPEEATLANPLDMIASATPTNYETATAAILADPNVDALMTIFVSPMVTAGGEVAEGIVRGVQAGLARAAQPKPVVACFMGGRSDDRGIQVLRGAHIPTYPFPEAAAQAIGTMAGFKRWLDLPEGAPQAFEVDRERATAVIAAARAAGEDWLSGAQAMELLAAYGIPTVPSAHVATPDEAIAFAAEHGYPVVLKLDVPEVVHKSDVGGVKVDLRSEGEIKGAFWDLQEALTRAGVKAPPRYLVQRMLTGGQETIIGAVEDAIVGHLLMFGLGGVFVELMRDVAFRVHPITDKDAERMIREVKGSPLLEGYRGAPPADLATLTEVILRVDQLIADFPVIAEMDLNPFIAAPAGQGSAAVDARVRLRPGPPAA